MAKVAFPRPELAYCGAVAPPPTLSSLSGYGTDPTRPMASTATKTLMSLAADDRVATHICGLNCYGLTGWKRVLIMLDDDTRRNTIMVSVGFLFASSSIVLKSIANMGSRHLLKAASSSSCYVSAADQRRATATRVVDFEKLRSVHIRFPALTDVGITLARLPRVVGLERALPEVSPHLQIESLPARRVLLLTPLSLSFS